jgi:hypothetical protein
VRFETFELVDVVRADVRLATEQGLPEVFRRLAAILDLLEAAANPLVQQYRPVQFDRLEWAE